MDQTCIHFLQWALPQLDMQWTGFRKVRRQVCKRIQKRIRQLGDTDWAAYRQYLERHPDEWKILDSFCRITISRFYRDYYLFDYLCDTVIPKIITAHPELQEYSCISLGSASGEEPYTLAILWREKICTQISEKSLRVIGLDVDPGLMQRASNARYTASSLRELPNIWREQAFVEDNELYTLKEDYKNMVEFILSDIRTYKFNGPFHLVCCRNLVATYFSSELQIEIFHKIRQAMPDGAALLLGTHERLSEEVKGFKQDQCIPQIYWTSTAS